MPTSPPQLSLEQRIEVETPEQVVFDYTIAGVGSRAAAAMLDYLICFLLLVVVVVITALTSSRLGRRVSLDVTSGWVAAIIVLAQFAIVWGYYVLFEGLADGQTPGKRAFKLRVVQDGGYSVSFAASAVRNLVRIIDLQPGFSYAVGMFSVILSKSGKRLGDYAGGTMVVRERIVHLPAAPSRDAAAGNVHVTAQLSDDEYAVLERFLTRRGALAPAQRRAITGDLAVRFSTRLPAGQNSVDEKLVALYETEQALRARGIAARSDKGAAREQHAIVAAGSARWSAFAAMLADAQTRGLKRLSESEVVEFVARYREMSTDLAKLRTAARGRDSESLFYLSRLVAGGHNLLYKQRQLDPTVAWKFITITVPQEVRRSAGPILLAALLLFGPGAAAYVAVVRDPALAKEFLSPVMLERAATALERERKGGGYIDARNAGPQMASQIATNNVQVTYLAFAMGITAAIGTVLVLVFNGVQLGGGLGIFASANALHQIGAFVLPHGVLELTAICIAGGGGILLGSAFLLPGALTRREALVVNGRRAIRLIMASTLFLIIAGLIEGFVSPLNLPLSAAYAIAGATGVLMLIYIFGAPGDAEGAPEEEHAYGRRALELKPE